MNKEMIKANAETKVNEKMRRDDKRKDDVYLSVEGPIGDEELPITEHLRELRKRLIVVLIPFGIVTLLIFPFSNRFLGYLLFHHLFPEEMALFVYSPMEWMSVRLLFSFIFALSVTIPLLVYEIFAFIRPGLYPSERKFFLMVVIPSLCCYGLGAVFAYLFVLPMIFGYLIAYSGDIARVALSAKRIFSIILYTAVGFGLIFQIPFIMTLAVKLKLVTHSWLRDKRLIIYGLIIGIAFFVIGDPMGISMIMAVVSIALFELGLLMTRYIGRGPREED
ncbi:MAG: twin-arginine translocase subunit TatC [Methanophagales archaeon]|nr:twin-arginine translocase subunit TatC [Methanophagales archaeon]